MRDDEDLFTLPDLQKAMRRVDDLLKTEKGPTDKDSLLVWAIWSWRARNMEIPY